MGWDTGIGTYPSFFVSEDGQVMKSSQCFLREEGRMGSFVGFLAWMSTSGLAFWIVAAFGWMNFVFYCRTLRKLARCEQLLREQHILIYGR